MEHFEPANFINHLLEDKRKTLSTPKKISKIVKPHFFLFNEMENAKKLRKIHGYKNHFYIFDTCEKMQLSELDEHEEKISLYKKIRHEEDILLRFEDKQLVYLEGYLKCLSSSKKYVLKLVEFYMHLLGSLKLLANCKLLHGNVSLKNIVVDKNEDVLLCNFSHSIDLTTPDIYEHLIVFLKENEENESEFDFKPLEWHILHHLSLNKKIGLSQFNIERIIDSYLQRNQLLHHFGKETLARFKQEGLDFFVHFVNKTYTEACQELLKYAETWDNYELSMTYLKILVGLQRAIKIPNIFVTHFCKLLVENVSSDPRKRHGIVENMELFEKIRCFIEMEDYLSLLNSLDKV
jgi:hypothetical protein